MFDAVNILNVLCRPQSIDVIVGWRGNIAMRHSDLLARARLWQALLRNTPGNNFALYSEDSLEFAAALFGAWHANKTIYLPSDTLPATCASLRTVVDGYLGEFPQDCMPLSPAPDAGDDSDLAPLSPDLAGLVVYTSGSTGAPQAISKKLSQLANEVTSLEQLFGQHAGTAEIVATVSHQHIYGLLFKVLWPLASGRPVHVRSLSYPEELVQVTTMRDCVLVASPAHLKRLPDSPVWTSAAHRIKVTFSSGGPLPSDVAQANSRLLGNAPIEVYGSSETGGIAWRQFHAGTDGRWTPMTGVELRLASNTDEARLEIRSPHLPDANWFRSSDRVQIMDDGRFILRGRIDRIVKIEEKRISLDRIEARLMQSPLVREARVLVRTDERDRVAAFVVLSDQGREAFSTLDKHALNNLLREHLADTVERIALPRRWRYLDALPVNAQGKTTYAELNALLDDVAPARQMLPRRRLIEKEAQRALFELTAPHDLLYFDGHFPNTPILPGVAQVDWAVMFSREYFELPPVFRGIHALKFQQVIRPEAAFSLELLHDAAKGSVSFKYFSSVGVHASGRLVFGAEHV